jgi:hypothetical protein
MRKLRRNLAANFSILWLVGVFLAGSFTVHSFAQTTGHGAAESHKTPSGNHAATVSPKAAISSDPVLYPEDGLLPGSRQYSQFAPYYTVGNGFMAMLMLNNATQVGYFVRVTLYSLDGQPAELPAIHLRPHEIKEVDLNEWVAGLGTKFMSGSLRLDYRGIAYALGAMVMMVNEVERVELDVLARHSFEFKSGRLEAVWWAPEQSAQVQFVVENTTDTQVGGKLSLVDVDGTGIKALELNLSPHETKVYKLSEALDEGRRHSATLGGISIEHQGKAGDLRAQCFILRRNKGFSASLQFEDPKNFTDSRLEGAGILLGNEDGLSQSAVFTGHLLVRNVSAEAVTVKPWVQHAGQPHPLPDVQLKPGGVAEVLVPADFLTKEAGATGIGMEYSGLPGSVLGYWFSMDGTGSLVVETPLRGPANIPQAGSNPFSLEGDSTSHLYIKNTGKTQGSFVVEIHHRQGNYMVGMKTVEAGDTAMINIRKLRDEQIRDVNGRKLPRNLTAGQINWRARGGSARLIGRVNTVSAGKGLANNMSCSTCCGCPTSVDVSFSPGSWTGDDNATFSFTPWETDSGGCSGTQSYPISASLLSWSSNLTSVASVDQSGNVSCHAAGEAWISGDGFFSDQIIDNSIEPANGCFFCMEDTTEQTPAAPADVKPRITGGNTVWWFSGQTPSGYATSVTLTSSGGASTTWAVTAHSDQISLSTTTGSTTTVTATGTAVSGAAGEVKITATVNSQTSTPFSLTTRRPFRLVAGTITTNCDATFGYLTDLNYTIQDNLLANMPSSVALNENWTTGVTNDFSGTNWRRGNAGSITTTSGSPAAFFDEIGGENVALPPNPTAACSGTATAVDHWGQEWKIGTTSIGVGTRVQTDTIQKYTQHAVHNSIATGSGVTP